MPLFLYLGDFSMKEAVPLSLFIILGVSSISTLNYYRGHRIEPKTGLYLEVFTLVGAVSGTYMNTFLSEKLLRVLLALVLFLTGSRTFLGIAQLDGRLGRSSRTERGTSLIYLSLERKLVIFMLAFLAGIISGSLGIGGGVLKVPILVYMIDIPMTVAAGTSELMIMLTSLGSGLTYYLRGRFELEYAFPFLLAGLAGAYVSTKVSMKWLGSKQLSTIFASFVVLVGLFMLLEIYL